MIGRVSRFILLGLFSLSTVYSQPGEPIKYTTQGLDMELLSYGGSLGGFYSHHPSEALSFDVEIDWSIIESNDSYTFVNYYGNPITVNNQNLSLVKILPGITWFPFMDTMHPSMQVGGFLSAGPVWALNTEDDQSFTKRWKHVDTSLAPMIRAGLSFRILSGQGGAYTFKLGYDYSDFGKKIDSRQFYKGIFFQAGMEFLSR